MLVSFYETDRWYSVVTERMTRNRLAMTLLFCFPAAVVLQAAAAAQDFTLREELGRQWRHECVTFPLTPAQSQQVAANRGLLGPDGKPVPTQVITGGDGKFCIAFHVDLAPYQIATWRFGDDVEPDHRTDLNVETTDRRIRITNALIGIELTKQPAAGDGPIAGFRLNSGHWAGASRLLSKSSVARWEMEVVESGPVLVEAICRAKFVDGGEWESHYRVYADEPVVLIDEYCSVNTPATLRLVLNDRFPATDLFYRHGNGRVGQNATWEIASGHVFAMEPWLQWWAAERRGAAFSLFHGQSNDLLTLAAREAGTWVDPTIAAAERTPPLIQVTMEDSTLQADFPLKHGQRKWLVGAFDRDTSLNVLKSKADAVTSPLPYQFLIKHGHFPLNVVKDYVLRWPSKLTHPRLLMTPPDVDRFKARVRDKSEHQKTVAGFLANPQLIAAHSLDRIIPAWLAVDDAGLTELLAKKAVDLLQTSVDAMIDQNGLPFGAAPHMNNGFATGIGLADIVMVSPAVDQQTRDRLQALAAFLGYTTARPDYWSTERGYAANPNMTSMVSGYLARIGSFISDHPEASKWAERGMQELKDQLEEWSDENGGWLEAPHYAAVAYDEILGMLVTAANGGFNDWLYTDPNVKKVIRWLAKIATPPDSRIGGYRHHPPIGNTYVHEPCGEYGLLAHLFREKDPLFSSEMQWMFHQNNKYGSPGIGGFSPTFAGYRQLLTDPDLPQSKPVYTSELFPETGVVLRDHYPSARETYLHLVQGSQHEHYDFDSGSLVLYGKGRILADEFGYNGRSPADQHSMVTSPQIDTDVMRVRDFKLTSRFDYVAGHKGGWTRQIAFVKGATPEAPAYFLMNDSLAKPGPATWRLWLTAESVRITGKLASVIGKEDVDMDVLFLNAGRPGLKTEDRTIQCGSGLYPNWQWRGMQTTQTGLTSSHNDTTGWNVVLFPRLKTEQRPRFESLSNGRGVKVVHGAGVDYVFLSREPFSFEDDTVQFQGTCGMAQLRAEKPVLAVIGKGVIRTGGFELRESR